MVSVQKSCLETGLTSREAASRREVYGPNDLPTAGPRRRLAELLDSSSIRWRCCCGWRLFSRSCRAQWCWGSPFSPSSCLTHWWASSRKSTPSTPSRR
ncbi:hypothetical protein H7I94_07030 [Mycobacterium szulgai]|nr:hypothetical protein [Mycobacterium szulgai]